MKRLPQFALLFVAAGLARTETRDPLPVPNIPGYATLKADFHLHTVFSDGEVWPTVRVLEAWHDGLDVIAITDHNGYNPHDTDVSKDLTRPYAIARGFARSLGLILVPGIEIAEGDTHANALFVEDPNALKIPGFLDALRAARKQNAYVFYNHPGWKETPRWYGLIAAAHDEKLVQGLEIVNGPDFYPEAYPWLEDKHMAAFANSDLHAPATAEYKPRTRPVTLVFARKADLDGVREALFERRTAAWMNGQIWGRESELRPLWAAAVQIAEVPSRVKRGAPLPLSFRNLSAIPFELKLAQKPEWLHAGLGGVSPERIGAFPAYVARDAPAGEQNVELKIEVTNAHIGPGKNLVISLPFTVMVE